MHLPAMTPVLLALAWAASAAHYTAAYSLWPFPEKPFRAEGWADVGALGLGEGEGGAGAAHEVLAFGDWNGDQACVMCVGGGEREGTETGILGLAGWTYSR